MSALRRVVLFLLCYFAILVVASKVKQMVPVAFGPLAWGAVSAAVLYGMTLLFTHRDGRTARDVGARVESGSGWRLVLGVMIGVAVFLVPLLIIRSLSRTGQKNSRRRCCPCGSSAAVARREDTFESDVDLAVVAAERADARMHADALRMMLSSVAEQQKLRPNVLSYDTEEILALPSEDPEMWNNLVRDAVMLHGPNPTALRQNLDQSDGRGGPYDPVEESDRDCAIPVEGFSIVKEKSRAQYGGAIWHHDEATQYLEQVRRFSIWAEQMLTERE